MNVDARSANANIEVFFESANATLSYLVHASGDAVVIDPVLDFDLSNGKTGTLAADRIAARIDALGLRLHYVLETHAHADHLSAAQYLRRRYGAKLGIGARIVEVQKLFRPLFGLGEDFAVDGSQFDVLFKDGEKIVAGALSIEVIFTPGHTPTCASYRVDDAVFVGDTIFIEDVGSGRCDFPGGSAETLHRSVHERLFSLPDATRIFVGHDYPPQGRAVRHETTVAAERAHNIHMKDSISREAFVKMRSERDRTLDVPRLIYPSVQINIDGGRLPAPNAAGARFLRMPLNAGRATRDDGTPL